MSHVPDDLMRLVVKYGPGKVATFNMREDMKINDQNMNTEFAQQASRFAEIAVATETAIHMRDRLEHELEVLKSETYRRLRGGGYAATYCMKPTEGALSKAVVEDAAVRAKEEEYLEAKHNASMLWAFKAAFEQRKEMLISLGANLRQELSAMRG